LSKTYIPEGYESSLGLYETQKAIVLIKRIFEDVFSGALNLRRVSAPLFVSKESGLNDNLNGVERPVEFDVPATGMNSQIVHSLAKWKRLALHTYGFETGSGLITDMNAIRRDEELDNLHSVYVDQWDWEKVISESDRNTDYLKLTVEKIVNAICDTQKTLMNIYPVLKYPIERKVSFITSQELEDMYPLLTPKQRENEYLKEHKTAFIMQIGKALKSGKPHDGRAPDYDDWELNGDIMFYNEVLSQAFEISSMGIRVSPESLRRQLRISGKEEYALLPFHKMLLNGELPYTIGGGIGQSRLCMLFLNKAHIGEVQSSVWDEETLETCKSKGVKLL